MEKGKVSIAVNMNTDRLQRKLRAISKHTEALVNELDEIDKDVCQVCGEVMEASTLYAEDKEVSATTTCLKCGITIDDGYAISKE
ncbi:hypothetical protein JMN23_16840 [Bacillus sp. RHFB]|nr:hypothetical protein [Bacillus sp. RHFB]